MGNHKLDPFRDLVQILLLGDVVESMIPVDRGLLDSRMRGKVDDRGEFDWSDVEWDHPY